MAKYNSKAFKELYNTFSKYFEQEGDVYRSVKESIFSAEDLIGTEAAKDFSKSVALSILQDAAADYYKNNIEILNQKEYLSKHGKKL